VGRDVPELGFDVFTDGVTHKAADDEVFTEFGDFALHKVGDGDVLILDEGLTHEALLSEDLVDLALDNLLDDGLGLALNLIGGDFALLRDEVRRDIVTSEILRIRSRDVEGDVLDEGLEDPRCGPRSRSRSSPRSSTPMRPAMWM
jgi:hypothetical protein